MLCHVVLVCAIHCITKMIHNHCNMLGDLNDEVFLVLCTFASFSVMSTRPQKAIYHQFSIKKIWVNKNVLRKPVVRCPGFPKPKINFLPIVVTNFFISKKTRHSYSRRMKKRLPWISNVLALFRNFNSPLLQKKMFQVGLLS